MTAKRHQIVIVGGGTAGISVAARLRRAKVRDIAIIDPATTHYYQPLWTLVGAGVTTAAATARPQQSVLPRGVTWIQRAAVGVDPDAQQVHLDDGTSVSYEFLVMAPGIQLDWDKVPGLTETLGRDGVSSNYRYDLAPKTWEFIRSTDRGSAIFTMPSGPIKCAGAPQKIAYLAADHWRRRGVLGSMDIHLVLPTPGMFGIPEFAQVLEQVAKRYGITVHFNSELVEVSPDARDAVIHDLVNDTKTSLPYDLMHVVPPQSAPDWVKASPLADPGNPAGYVAVDQYTMRHVTYPNVFSLGDAGSTPNSKTGAAIRKQAPVVTKNLLAVMAGREPEARYNGYASCPLTTSYKTMLLAEFDYNVQPTPSIPLINTKKERRDMWYLKRYGLPFLYWNLMLKGLA